VIGFKDLEPMQISEFRDFPFDEESARELIVRITASVASSYRGLNRYLSIPNRLIFASRVESGMPSLAAAPAGPDIRP
jgi:hypothetical protein